ncbi:outer membrane protein assembly factor BamE [Salmonella enterica]|nr:outer membrane protein assembly factor BamE [Salmonella enterica subsp. diarizonae serovar 48:i:z]EEH1871486.1 outer membrane protein assembly factor BamE [Salmonella enterica]EEM2740524.1 outer membrane protein assembly factor BamE [Salmonella enterica]EEM9672627.1 outer membrane protein assembly factor BamE [Salmonella enterica]EEN5932130.1 outer membrane protein assembly factor BamE [Salmonella enterica]
MKIYPVQLLLLMAVAGLSGCHQNPSHPERDGSIKKIVWPAPESAKQGAGLGVFPTPESIALLNKGMTKDQVYLLIGRPHFDEGVFSVREWDYLLHFRTPGSGTNGITTCQLKIIYNSDKLISGIYWRAVEPENALCPPDSGQQKEKNRYALSTDILFGLNQYEFDKSNPDALKNIDKIISDIRKRGGYENIAVYGYTDWQGDRRYNMRLSALRAETVANYFIASGFPENKVFPKGMGETIPKTSCPGLKGEKLTACLLPDRKVVIVVNPHE